MKIVCSSKIRYRGYPVYLSTGAAVGAVDGTTGAGPEAMKEVKLHT
jgi:hypothetical protein